MVCGLWGWISTNNILPVIYEVIIIIYVVIIIIYVNYTSSCEGA